MVSCRLFVAMLVLLFVCFGNGMWSDPCTILPQDRDAGHDGLHYSRATRMHVLVSVFLVKGGALLMM